MLINSKGSTSAIRPEFCCFGITDECFLRCKMCHKWKPDLATGSSPQRPSLQEWKRAIESLRNITEEGFLINFGGGEALLYEGVLDLVRFATDLKFRTNIATNGYLIDEAMARRIADSGLSSINISLDSLNASTHDYLRGVEGVYKKVSFAIEYLEKFAPHLKKGICCVIYGVNLDDIIPLVESIEKDKRLDWIYFMAAMQPNNTVPDKGWYKNEDYKYLWPIDKERVNSVIEHLIRLKNKDSKIVNPIPQLRVFASYFSNPDRFIKLVECNLSRAIHVSSTGDVFICFSYNKLGNIISGKIENLWSSEAALDIRKKISNCRKNCHFLINCFFEDDFPFSF